MTRLLLSLQGVVLQVFNVFAQKGPLYFNITILTATKFQLKLDSYTG